MATGAIPIDDEPVPLADTMDGSLGDPTYALDGDGRFEAVNEALLALTGYAREELLGEHVSLLMHEAIEHGGPEAVEVGPLPDAAGFYVVDDGLGIAPARRERVFDHGYTTSEQGIGLGLIIVETVIDAHGWELTVTESERGSVRFEIPTS